MAEVKWKYEIWEGKNCKITFYVKKIWIMKQKQIET